MKRWHRAWFGPGALVLAACVPATARTPNGSEELRRARAFDAQGVLAFESGRFHDALVYFDAARAHGGPASEDWNAARCQLRLDEPERAEAALRRYLAAPGLTRDDAREAQAALDAIQHRASVLTITSTPLGLGVRVDGHHIGTTPVSLTVAAGTHGVAIEPKARAPAAEEHRVLARYGRAILVEILP